MFKSSEGAENRFQRSSSGRKAQLVGSLGKKKKKKIREGTNLA